jgi:hypothetical protein
MTISKATWFTLSIAMGIILTPELEIALKAYVLSAIFLSNLGVHLLFKWQKLRKEIVDRSVADIWLKLYRDNDEFNTLVNMKVKKIMAQIRKEKQCQ